MSTKTTDNLLIVTAHAEFMQAAIAEIKHIDKEIKVVEEFTPEIALCGVPKADLLLSTLQKAQSTFVRHVTPVQGIVDISNTEQDLMTIATAIADLSSFAQLERGVHFAVQSRFVQTDKRLGERPYSSGHLNQSLAGAFAEETGAVENIKKPRVIISILCAIRKAYIGISTPEENISSWPGGARHFAQTTEQISRAEFKLLEALEVFDLSLPRNARILDLGAAPGGWTRLLLEAGASVIAVDPAQLDSRLMQRRGLEHYRGYAEHFLEEAIQKRWRFDVIANDMRMDARDAARLLAYASPCLHLNGFVISVLKLPHATHEIDPLVTLREALSILKGAYGLVQARQLFHNRQEVTVVAAQPLPKRRS